MKLYANQKRATWSLFSLTVYRMLYKSVYFSVISLRIHYSFLLVWKTNSNNNCKIAKLFFFIQLMYFSFNFTFCCTDFSTILLCMELNLRSRKIIFFFQINLILINILLKDITTITMTCFVLKYELHIMK